MPYTPESRTARDYLDWCEENKLHPGAISFTQHGDVLVELRLGPLTRDAFLVVRTLPSDAWGFGYLPLPYEVLAILDAMAQRVAKLRWEGDHAGAEAELTRAHEAIIRQLPNWIAPAKRPRGRPPGLAASLTYLTLDELVVRYAHYTHEAQETDGWGEKAPTLRDFADHLETTDRTLSRHLQKLGTTIGEIRSRAQSVPPPPE